MRSARDGIAGAQDLIPCCVKPKFNYGTWGP